MNNDVTIYVDMDGVLATWSEEASEEETHTRGYFLSRPADVTAVEFVKTLCKNGYDVRILSAVYQDDHSAKEKEQWLLSHGLDIPHVFVPYGDSKGDYLTDTSKIRVLIDDYNKNLKEWEKVGLPIKYFNGINNRPKLEAIGNVIRIRQDSWTGYSVDNRMSSRQMYMLLTGLVNAFLSEKEAV